MLLQVLLVEDSPGDVRLTQEAFHQINGDVRLHVASDGAEAIAFLRREGVYVDAPRPDLTLLDLNLPKMDGREVLALIKGDDNLKSIPTVILTTSQAEADVIRSYKLHANCYFTKPVQLEAFENLVKSINDFWLTRVALPSGQGRKGCQGGKFPATGGSRESNRMEIMPIEVLLVEDNPVDVRFTHEAFRAIHPSIHFHVVSDGVEAMAFLRHEGAHLLAPRPSLILLDLNLPKMGGREVLTHIKEDESLKAIPTVILTTSGEEEDIAKSYQLQANCYLNKPTHLDDFEDLVKSINELWLRGARLPGGNGYE